MPLVKTTKYTTPFTLVANSGMQSETLPAWLDSGMYFAKTGDPELVSNGYDGFYVGYARYHKEGQIDGALDFVQGTGSKKNSTLSQAIKKKLLKEGKGADGNPFIFVFLTFQATAMYWADVDEGMPALIEKLGGDTEWYDLNQKCVYRGSADIFNISYALVSLVKLTKNDTDFETITAYEKADIGKYAQAGLSLTIDLEWVTSGSPPTTVIENFELNEFD